MQFPVMLLLLGLSWCTANGQASSPASTPQRQEEPTAFSNHKFNTASAAELSDNSGSNVAGSKMELLTIPVELQSFFTAADFEACAISVSKTKQQSWLNKSTFSLKKLLPAASSKKLPAPPFHNFEYGFLRNEYAGFWTKAARAELLIGGVELIGMATLIAMPKEVTKWPEDWMKDATRNWGRAFTNAPKWDEDDWAINYLGHPIAGSYYYNAVRSQNATWLQSLLFATVQSFFWEYVIEGVAEQPSIQDFVTTPLGGMLLGEPAHLITMNMRRNGFKFMEKVFVILLNPMYAINNGFGPKHNPVRVK